MHRPAALIAALLLAGCGGSSEVAWMRGFGLRWNIANHRVSQAALLPNADGVQAAFIGGASTTGCVFVEGQGCVADVPEDDACLVASSCAELPFLDTTLVAVDRVVARAEGRQVVGSGSADLLVRPEGASGSILVELPYGAGGDATAWIRGLALSTDVPKPSDSASCYDPRHGWLPTKMRFEVGQPDRQSGRVWLVPVSATFASGISYEAIRTCLDAVAEEAALSVRIDVAMAVGAEARTETISQAAVWERGDEQTLADLGSRDADVGAIAGWRVLDWTFDDQVEPGRGVYVRSLAAWVDPDAGRAWGLATNDSPTQLSGLDMAFEGELVVVDGLELIEEGVWGLDRMETALTEEGAAILYDLEEPVEVPTFTK